MSLRARRLTLTGFLLATIVGAVLVITATEGPDLERVVTAEGLVTEIPEGWVAVAERPFEFVPADSGGRVVDRWTVARACGPDGCVRRSLAEWLVVGESLPTFIGAQDDEGELLFEVRDAWRGNARILRAVTEAGAEMVFVAAFTDGADFYVECGVVQSVGDDLVGAVVDVCRKSVSID